MTDRTPLDDIALDRLLGLAPQPPMATDLVDRIVAAAQRPGRTVLPGRSRPSTRPRRWTRRTVWTGVIAINLMLASAVATAFGGGVLSMAKIAVVAHQIAHHLRHPLEKTPPSHQRSVSIGAPMRVETKPVQPAGIPLQILQPHASPTVPLAQPFRPDPVLPMLRMTHPARPLILPRSLRPHSFRPIASEGDRHVRQQQKRQAVPDRPVNDRGERRVRPSRVSAPRAAMRPEAAAPVGPPPGPAWRAPDDGQNAAQQLNGPGRFGRRGRRPGWRRRFDGPNAGPGPRLGPPRGPGRPFRRGRRPF